MGAKRQDFCEADLGELQGRTRPKPPAPEMPGLGALFVEQIASLVAKLEAVVSSQFDAAIMENPETFAFLNDPQPVTIQAGTAKEVYQNTDDVPVLVRVQGEVSTALGTASFLMLAKKAAGATEAGNVVSDYRVGPRASVILPPNASLYADATKPGGSAGDNVVLLVTVVPLRGRRAVFGGR